MNQPHEPAPTFESILVELAERRARDALVIADLLTRLRERQGLRAFDEAEHARLLDEHRQRRVLDPIIRPMTEAERTAFRSGDLQPVLATGRSANDNDPSADQELQPGQYQRVDAHVGPLAEQRWGLRVRAPVDGQRAEIWLSMRNEAAARRLAQELVDRNDPELVDHVSALTAMTAVAAPDPNNPQPAEVRYLVHARPGPPARTRRMTRRPGRPSGTQRGRSRSRQGPRVDLAAMEHHVRRAWSHHPEVARAVIGSPGWNAFARRLDTLRRRGHNPEHMIGLIPVRGVLPDDTTIVTADRPAAFATALLDRIVQNLEQGTKPPTAPQPSTRSTSPSMAQHQPTGNGPTDGPTGIFVDDGEGPYELNTRELGDWISGLDSNSEIDAVTAEHLYGECGPATDAALIKKFPRLTNPGARLSDAVAADRRASSDELDAARKLGPDHEDPAERIAASDEGAADHHEAAAERAEAAELRNEAAAPAARADVTLTPTEAAKQRATSQPRTTTKKPARQQPQRTKQPRRTR